MRNKEASLVIAVVIALSVLSGITLLSNGACIASADAGTPAGTQDDWKKEFEDICSKTQDAMSFTPDELKSFLNRCDALKPRVEMLDETQKKVYLKRLQMYRDLLAFVIESTTSLKTGATPTVQTKSTTTSNIETTATSTVQTKPTATSQSGK